MKNLIRTVIILITMLSIHSHAETVNISFNQDDFTVTVKNGVANIESNLDNIIYPSNVKYAIPAYCIAVATTEEGPYEFDYSYPSPSLLFNDVLMEEPPCPIPTDISDSTLFSDSNKDNDQLEMLPVCKYIGSEKYNGYGIARFLICPYIYAEDTRTLSWVGSLSIHLTGNKRIKSGISKKNGDSDHLNFYKEIVCNPETLEKIVYEDKSTSSPSLVSAVSEGTSNGGTVINYVIITSAELKSSFEVLSDWKTEKGVRTQVKTIEDISQSYEGLDMQLKIKKYLYDLYINNGLIYVMLGGDDTVVPVRGCYGKVNQTTYEDFTIPTDLYYGCFGGRFDWDANQNGIYGEVSDQISLQPNVYVTRVPVRTKEQTLSFIKRILDYERFPNVDNKMLLAGKSLYTLEKGEKKDKEDQITAGKSNAHYKAEEMYVNSIKDNWAGQVYYLYDTEKTNYPTEQLVNNKTFTEELNRGYTFIDVITHGKQTNYALELEEYTSSVVYNSNNNFHTIITTLACLTNAFDTSKEGGLNDPCLSEAFIRHNNSGILAYLGCSRAGWLYKDVTYTWPSIRFNELFYKTLFDKNNEIKNFGKIIAQAKMRTIGECLVDSCFRWIQFGLNPVGDPEMPIYTSLPKKLKLYNTIDSNGVKIKSNVEEVRFCLTGEDNGNKILYLVRENDNEISSNYIPEFLKICLSKNNYAVLKESMIFLQNKQVDSLTYKANNIRIGRNVNPTKTQGDVTISNSNFHGNEILLQEGVLVEGNTQFITRNQTIL